MKIAPAREPTNSRTASRSRRTRTKKSVSADAVRGVRGSHGARPERDDGVFACSSPSRRCGIESPRVPRIALHDKLASGFAVRCVH